MWLGVLYYKSDPVTTWQGSLLNFIIAYNRAITIVDRCKGPPLGSQIVCYILFNDVVPISDVIDFSLVYTIKYFDFESFVLMYLIALTEEVLVYWQCDIMLFANDFLFYLGGFISFFQDKVLINQWKDEILNGFKLSTQIMANMNKKASKMYGAEINNSSNTDNFRPPLEHRNSNGS